MSIDAAAAPSESSSASIQSIQLRAQAAINSLSLILGPLPEPLALFEDPTAALLHDPGVAREISRRLRRPGSGTGDDNLCRWLYDTFQSTDPGLQLAVLNFVPAVAGVYLSRAISRQPVAGFEAVLLALYAHETLNRNGEARKVTVPNVLSTPSVYQDYVEPKPPTKSNQAMEPAEVAILSPALEPHGTVRSTKRARIVGVALELYYSKICHMPVSSKLEFCEFCVVWAGNSSDADADRNEGAVVEGRNGGEEGETKRRRVPLPWELLQPVLRIVGHCLLGPSGPEELRAAAAAAARCLHQRALHDTDPKAILATKSLLALSKMPEDTVPEPTLSSLSSDLAKFEAMRNNV